MSSGVLSIDVSRHEKSKPELFERRNENNSSDAHLISWRNEIARFDQVIDVSDADRALSFANIGKAAKYYNVNLSEIP